jgi:hypothetical protein
MEAKQPVAVNIWLTHSAAIAENTSVCIAVIISRLLDHVQLGGRAHVAPAV